MADFIAQYQAAFEAVEFPLTASHSCSDEEIKAAEKRLGHHLPQALANFYRVAGKSNFLCNLYTLVNLSDLQNQNGKLVILFDPDGGICDGIDLPADSEDPMVHSTNNLTLPGWEVKQGFCSQYLVYAVFYEAAENDFPIIADATITESIRILADRKWKLFAVTDDYRVYASADCVIVLWKSGDDWAMRVGMKELTTLDEISHELGITLERIK